MARGVDVTSRLRSMPRASVASCDVTLSEEGGVRYLHFGSEWIQGAMRLRKPFDLELEYTRQMMAWLLFLAPEQRSDFDILQLGLGAASLAKFCWKHCAPARVTAVELSPEVIACAHRMFMLPADDARIAVVQADAADYLARPRVRATADVVQVDLYDADARGPVYGDEAFYRACRKALREPGVLVVNLFGAAHSTFARNMAAIGNAFEGRVLALPEIDAGNRIALAFAGPAIERDYVDLYERAADIQARCGLAAKRWVGALKSASAQRGDVTPTSTRAAADRRAFRI